MRLSDDAHGRLAFRPNRQGRWTVSVRQSGIDVDLAVIGDNIDIHVNSPTGRDGWDTAVFGTDPAQSVCIVLRADRQAVRAGKVSVRIDAVPASAPAASARNRIFEHLLAADSVYLSNRSGSFGAALRHYELAAELAGEHGFAALEARATHSRARLAFELGHNADAAAFFHAAATGYASLNESVLAAWTHTFSGLALVYTGDFDAAAIALETAQTLFSAEDNEYGIAVARNNRCLLLHYRGDYLAALPCYRSAAAGLLALQEYSDLAVVYNNIGRVLDLTGSPGTARESYRKSLELHREFDNPAREAQTLNNLGLLERRLGNFQAAISRYRQALDIQRVLGNDLERAVLLHNIGLVYYHLGEGRRALRFLERALPLRRRVGDRRGEAFTLSGIGTVLLRLGDGGKAAGYFRRSYEIRMELGDTAGQARAFLRLGESLGVHGRDELALTYLDRALEMYRASGDKRRLAESHYKRAVILERHDRPAAVKNYKEAIRAWLQADDPLGPARAMLGLARIEQQNDNLARAMTFVNDSIARTESSRNRIPDPRLRGAFLSIRQEAYKKRIEVLMSMDEKDPGSGNALRALVLNDGRIARTFDEILYRRNGDTAPDADERPAVVADELERDLNASTAELSRLVATDADESALLATRRRIDDLVIELQSSESGYDGSRFDDALFLDADLAGLHDIQEELLEGELILHYFLGDDRGYVWSIDADSVSSYEIAAKDRVVDAVERVLDTLRAPKIGGGCDRLEAAATLSDMLLRPVYDRLPAYSRLIVVPDGALAHIPFSILAGKPVAAAAGAGCYTPLVESITVEYRPSLFGRSAQGVDPVSSPGGRDDILVVSDAVYSKSDSRFSFQAPEHSPESGAPVSASRNASSLQRLHWSSTEAAEL
ncbi:MAG: CHAT domain-containing protein, partial [Proteobacteria bacterium]|nr:CHAT domain-containing protein [Pseudomonadota bacterium]